MKRLALFLFLCVGLSFSTPAYSDSQDSNKDISLYTILNDWLYSANSYRTSTGNTTTAGSSITGLGNCYVLQINAKQASDRIDLISGATANDIKQSTGYSLFFRGANCTYNYPSIGIYNTTEKSFVPKIANTVPQNVGDSAIYGVVYNKALNQAKVYIGLCDTDGNVTSQKYMGLINGDNYNITSDNTYVGAGYNGNNTSGITTFKVGNALKCVTVGSSSLIESLQYSDTFNRQDRIDNKGYDVNGPYTRGKAYYDVENCYGNDQVKWVGSDVFSVETSYNV